MDLEVLLLLNLQTQIVFLKLLLNHVRQKWHYVLQYSDLAPHVKDLLLTDKYNLKFLIKYMIQKMKMLRFKQFQ